ncbi:MAG: hypothetical protein IAF02_00685 [Anaerolineae bacterium]|nr:hypothetical protein [Anaerolineae bacterium]
MWLAQALSKLLKAGSISEHGASFIINNQVMIRIKPFTWWQQGMGIRWTVDGAIEMRADKVSWQQPVKVYQLSGLVHEVKHLEQGKRVALSQLGEVQAWFTEYKAGRELGLRMKHIPAEVVAWGELPTKENFIAARRAIIQQQSRRYLFWLLPPYPFVASYEVNLAKLLKRHD